MPKLVFLCANNIDAMDNHRNAVAFQNPRHITLESGVCDG